MRSGSLAPTGRGPTITHVPDELWLGGGAVMRALSKATKDETEEMMVVSETECGELGRP
jgi:hypothetical protein